MSREATDKVREISASGDNNEVSREQQIPYNLRKRPRRTGKEDSDPEWNKNKRRTRTGRSLEKKTAYVKGNDRNGPERGQGRERERGCERGETRGRDRWHGQGRRRGRGHRQGRGQGKGDEHPRGRRRDQKAVDSNRKRDRSESRMQAKKRLKGDSICQRQRQWDMLRRLGQAVVDVCSCADQEERKATFEAVEFFLELLGHSSLWEESVFITALVLIDRVISAKNPITITPHRVCELFCGLVLLASKFLRDLPTLNWEASTFVSLEQIHKTEYELLKCLDWNVWVSEVEFDKYKAMIMR